MEREDYPRTLEELEARFSTEMACEEYLMNLRWPSGFICPRCGARTVWRATRGRLVCASCRYHASVTAGTIFQDTRKPLTLWFRAIWYVTNEYYLDEYTFRFNRGASKSREKLFYRLIQQAVQIEPVPYDAIVGGTEKRTLNHN